MDMILIWMGSMISLLDPDLLHMMIDKYGEFIQSVRR